MSQQDKFPDTMDDEAQFNLILSDDREITLEYREDLSKRFQGSKRVYQIHYPEYVGTPYMNKSIQEMKKKVTQTSATLNITKFADSISGENSKNSIYIQLN